MPRNRPQRAVLECLAGGQAKSWLERSGAAAGLWSDRFNCRGWMLVTCAVPTCRLGRGTAPPLALARRSRPPMGHQTCKCEPRTLAIIAPQGSSVRSAATPPWARFPGVTRGWKSGWVLTGRGRAGGQGRSSRVVDSEGRVGFLKELIRPRDRRARARFRREVTSYETLAGHPSLPEVWEHNADRWTDLRVELYLVLEHIDGGTVGDRLRHSGVLDLKAAIALVRRLCEIVQFCHENDVVHRDLKPENVLLRDGDASDPVIIDFGLAFNDLADEPELTRVNEEVGNRFLRLPEHSSGGRNPISDVAQLVGLLFYVLVGAEPRVLQDGDGRMPHHRPEARERIDGLAATAPQLRRLLSVFDRGFAFRTASRFQSAAQLREALEAIMSEDPAKPDLDALFRSLDADVPADDRRRVADAAATINSFRSGLHRSLTEVAQARSLEVSWGNGPDTFASEPPSGRCRYALTVPGVIPTSFPEWTVELVSDAEISLVMDGLQVWRGTDPTDSELRDIMFAVLIEHFRTA